MKTIDKLQITFGVLILLLIVILLVVNGVGFFKGNKISEKSSQYSCEIFKTGEKGWGYSITKEKQLLIRQDIIPAIENKLPFQSENDARKTGVFVVEKLKNGKLPTVSRDDLERLKVVIK